jgi:hypothetical protein
LTDRDAACGESNLLAIAGRDVAFDVEIDAPVSTQVQVVDADDAAVQSTGDRPLEGDIDPLSPRRGRCLSGKDGLQAGSVLDHSGHLQGVLVEFLGRDTAHDARSSRPAWPLVRSASVPAS